MLPLEDPSEHTRKIHQCHIDEQVPLTRCFFHSAPYDRQHKLPSAQEGILDCDLQQL